MSLTLKDLRVSFLKHWVDLDGTPDGVTSELRDASIADLVEVLKQEGARELSQAEQWNHDLYPGRYLVLPLDGDA